MTTSTQKVCAACEKPIRGRSDKKFCNDYCRNGYNNIQKAPAINLIRNTNNALLKNRRIMDTINQGGGSYTKIYKSELQRLGFDFEKVTEICKNRQGSCSYFCYDYGYLSICEEELVLFKKENT